MMINNTVKNSSDEYIEVSSARRFWVVRLMMYALSTYSGGPFVDISPSHYSGGPQEVHHWVKRASATTNIFCISVVCLISKPTSIYLHNPGLHVRIMCPGTQILLFPSKER
jgi:hypothetical protein